MPPIRLPGAARRLLAVLLLSLLALLLLWLALPRLLGLAAEHWLAVPGLEELQVDVEEVGGEHARLREVRAVYQSAGGDRYRIALHNIAIDYSLPGGQVERLDVASGELELLTGQTAPPSPWPLLEWPNLPLGEAQVRDLRVTVTWPDRPERPRLEARGDFRLRQTAGQWQAEFRPDADLLRITAIPPQAPDTALEIHAEWLPAVGPAADARLSIGRQPTQQAAKLLAQLPLPVLAALARHLGLALPLGEISGSVRLQAEALLGETAGNVRALNGEAEFADSRVQATAGPLAFELSGKLRFAWQASAAQLELLPGLRWQLASDGEQALQVSGRQETAFAIRHDNGVAVSEGELAFAVQSPQWGHWQGALRRLTLHGGTDPADWRSADAQLRLQGQLPPSQQKTIRVGEVKAAGDATLHWSRSAEVRSELAMQVGVGRLSWLSDPPLRVNASTWQVKAVALAQADDPFGPSLVVQGEASSPQLTAVLAGRPDKTLTLGASRLQLLHFRPAGRSAAGDAPNKGGAGVADGELLLSADALRIGNWPSPDLRARLRLDGDALRADGTLRLQQTEVLSFAGSHALARGCGNATLAMQQNLPKLGQLLQPRPPALLKLALLAGEADAHFTVDWCTKSTPRFDVKGKLQARAVALGWERARVEGLRTTLQLDGLQPLRGRLQLAARGGALATGTSLSDLDVDLALAAQTLSVRALQVKLLGGSVGSEPLDLPWPPSDKPLPLQVRQIDLGQLLALLQVHDLSGSGQLGGVLPLAWRDGGVEVDNGELSSASGGTIKYAPPLLTPDNPGLQALRNFHFQQLGVRLWYGSEGAYRTRATLEGSNPDFYSGYPVRFRLNINGQLPGLFRAALFSGDFNRHILEQLQSGKLE